MAGALIDRLLHHCHIVNIGGNSYRMRHHSELWNRPQTSEPAEPKPRPKRRKGAAKR